VPTPKAHGLYTEAGRRINEWNGQIVMDFDTGYPKLDPPLRLSEGEKVFAWWQGKLVAAFGPGGLYVEQALEPLTATNR
jgi:hypothetical protein